MSLSSAAPSADGPTATSSDGPTAGTIVLDLTPAPAARSDQNLVVTGWGGDEFHPVYKDKEGNPNSGRGSLFFM